MVFNAFDVTFEEKNDLPGLNKQAGEPGPSEPARLDWASPGGRPAWPGFVAQRSPAAARLDRAECPGELQPPRTFLSAPSGGRRARPSGRCAARSLAIRSVAPRSLAPSIFGFSLAPPALGHSLARSRRIRSRPDGPLAVSLAARSPVRSPFSCPSLAPRSLRAHLALAIRSPLARPPDGNVVLSLGCPSCYL